MPPIPKIVLIKTFFLYPGLINRPFSMLLYKGNKTDRIFFYNIGNKWIPAVNQNGII